VKNPEINPALEPVESDANPVADLFASSHLPAYLLKPTEPVLKSVDRIHSPPIDEKKSLPVAPEPDSPDSEEVVVATAPSPKRPSRLIQALNEDDPDVRAQFRLRRLQAFNWGTFQGVADFPIAHEGYLFVGNSGSGKSTMLDAFAALTTPPKWLSFNAAAREADRGRSDRNLVTYVRGAWARQSNDEREAVQQFLRKGTTWTVLAATFRNAQGGIVTLVVVLWLRGAATSSRDVKHLYMVLEREFDVTELETPFAKTDFDVRKLKAAFPEIFIREEFVAYQERFCRLLGIENERALRLLHKTQSTKDLGDLNVFLRDFMLDEPETFEVAERLVKDFKELNEAHGEVVSARKQIETLRPARCMFGERAQLVTKIEELLDLDAHLDSYAQERRGKLLDTEIEAVKKEIAHAQIQIKQTKGQEAHEKGLRDQLTGQLQGSGGGLLQSLEERISRANESRAGRLTKRAVAEAACQALDWPPISTAETFLDAQSQARELLGGPSPSESLEQRRDPVKAEYDKKAARLQELKGEIESMIRQPSNIPQDYLRVRQALADDMEVEPKDLPFAGELMEVKDEEKRWTGAVERVLRGFSLSIVVPEELYADFSRAINARQTGMRVVYLRALVGQEDRRPIGEASLVRKINLARGPHQEWMRQQLRSHFDYECVEDLVEFRSATRAVTLTGQVKHSATRHEKDDRRSVGDRMQWVMGLDNLSKRQAFEQEAGQVAVRLSVLHTELNALSEERKTLEKRRVHANTLVNMTWEEMDIDGLLTEIGQLQRQLDVETARHPDLADLREKVANQEAHYEAAVKKRQAAEADEREGLKRLTEFQKTLETLRIALTLSATQRSALDERVQRTKRIVTLGDLDSIMTSVTRGIAQEREALNKESARLQSAVERIFSDYVRVWPVQAGGLDAKLESSTDFFAKLERLETDDLPRVEERFLRLLQEQSNQKLVSLQQKLADERKRIYDRLEQVNASLATADYNPGTHLVIEVHERVLDDVKAFREQLREALSQAFSLDKSEAERRFAVLSAMVKRFSSQELEDRNWRSLVLDVRLHVDFRVRELDGDDIEREVYHSGAGKSGGQRQKLAAACLAAALRYQLGGQDRTVPAYSTVVLDEAFDKADAEFTAAAMTIFKTFGFQMIIATPMRSVMTLEPFIGGASVVHIAESKYSRFSQVTYDTKRGGLGFSEEDRALARDAD
jgi:uncharacterized protein YPO0396